MFSKLQLTAEQRQELNTYRTNNRAAFQSALLGVLQAKAALENAISQNNTGNLAGLTANLATAQTKLMQLRAQKEAYLVSILTPEQKSTWTEIQNKKATRLQDRINNLQGQ
jgi:Spy/CpxP family protein refolding chaperone